MNTHRNFGPIRSWRSEAHSDWQPPRTSYHTELAAESRRRLMRRLTTTGFVVLCGMLVSIYLWGQVMR